MRNSLALCVCARCAGVCVRMKATYTVLIVNALLNSERLDDQTAVAMVDRLFQAVAQ